MKCILVLKYLFLFCLFSFSFSSYELIGNGVIKNLTEEIAFIDTSDFTGYFNLLVEVTVKEGKFYENYLFIQGSDYKLTNLSSDKFSDFYSWEYQEKGTLTSWYYNYWTLHYKIPLDNSYNYLYLQFPNFVGDYLEVKITTTGIPIAIAWICLIAIIAIIVGIIIFLRYRKKKQIEESDINQLIQENQQNRFDY